MKRLFVILLSMSVLSGCATYRSMRGEGVAVRQTPAPAGTMQAPVSLDSLEAPNGGMQATPGYATEAGDLAGANIERVPFRAGVSTVTVENMAKKEGCWGTQGAGLMTPPGPVEVYRLICDNGAVYTAKCELRQCKRLPSPMRAPAAAPAVPRSPD